MDEVYIFNVFRCVNGSLTRLPRLPEGEYIYRAVDDRWVPSVVRSQGFPFPPNNRVYAGFQGGLVFAMDDEHVMGYANSREQHLFKHFFACSKPDGNFPTFDVMSRDHPLWGKIIEVDIVITNVVSGTHKGNEFIKYGENGSNYSPDDIFWIQAIPRHF